MANKTYIYGKHSVMEAVKGAPRAIVQVFLAESPNAELKELLHKGSVRATSLAPGDLPKGFDRGVAHQGYIALVDARKITVAYEDFMRNLAVSPETSVVILGEIQDPHNVGAIIRSAAAFGVAGIFIPEHNQAPITGAVVKVSAGMAFRIPLVEIGNVNTTVRELKEKGFWIYGLAEDAKGSVATERFDHPSAFIFGNEGSGIREKTREHCDILLSVPMHPRAESLNVAASAAVTLFAWSSQHPKALKN